MSRKTVYYHDLLHDDFAPTNGASTRSRSARISRMSTRDRSGTRSPSSYTGW